jgi:hypothetical protein
MEPNTNHKPEHTLSARWRICILIFLALSIAGAIYIMIHSLGLIDSLDFGAGAYYYADIPGFEKFVNGDAYTSPVGMPVLIALFLLWGALMYRLWIKIDRLPQK